jgi:hypothetical protein
VKAVNRQKTPKCQETSGFIWILIACRLFNQKAAWVPQAKTSNLYLGLTLGSKAILFLIDEQELCFVNFITYPLELCLIR